MGIVLTIGSIVVFGLFVYFLWNELKRFSKPKVSMKFTFQKTDKIFKKVSKIVDKLTISNIGIKRWDEVAEEIANLNSLSENEKYLAFIILGYKMGLEAASKRALSIMEDYKSTLKDLLKRFREE